MREGWEFGVLEDGFVKASSNLSVNKLNDDNGDFPFYGAKGLIKKISFYHQETEYIAIIKDGAGVGRVSIHPPKSSVVGTLQYLLPKKGFDLSFLYYYLLSIDFSKHSTGSTIPHIYFKDYKSEPFPLVSKEEQKEIVSILDDAFASIDKAKTNIERNIENAKELFQSKLNEVFSQTGEGWAEKKLGDICETTQGVQIPKSKQFTTPANGLRRYLYISDFKSEKNLKYVEDIYPKKIVTDEDLIVVNTGNSSGDVFRGIDGILSNNLFKVSFERSKILSDYIFYFLFCDLFISFQDKIKRGTANPHMGHKNFSLTPISIPPFIKQLEIVELVTQLNKVIKSSISNYEKELDNLEDLKKSILQKAFNGELTNKTVAA